MQGSIFYAGPYYTIEAAVLEDGSMPARHFVESRVEGERAKLYALFRMLGETGRISNQEKFKKIEGTDFFEL